MPLWRQKAGRGEDKLVVWVSKRDLLSVENLDYSTYELSNDRYYENDTWKTESHIATFSPLQDYHVFFMHNPSPNRCLVFDLDTTLPFPTYFHKYVTETFRSDYAVSEDHHRFFRVITADEYLTTFSSDRRHMKRPDGSWIKVS